MPYDCWGPPEPMRKRSKEGLGAPIGSPPLSRDTLEGRIGPLDHTKTPQSMHGPASWVPRKGQVACSLGEERVRGFDLPSRMTLDGFLCLSKPTNSLVSK